MDAGKYYALLRFEEASLALRAALRLEMVERIGDQQLDPSEFRELFGFTEQGGRTFAALLEVMEVLQRARGLLGIAPRAAATLAQDLPTSRRPYLAIGIGDRVDELIEMLCGRFPNASLPLYAGDDESTVMDQPEAARDIALGLASRARNFADPLAAAIKPYANKTRIIADIGAGSPYVALACIQAIPHLGKVVLVDRTNGMQYAREMVTEDHLVSGAAAKLEFVEQDFFQAVPPADMYCLSNTAHDWLPDEVTTIMTHIRDSIAPGGVVCVHEPLLLTTWNSAAEWVRALWMASYALTLYQLCQGKGTCYSRDEHNDTMRHCGFVPVGEPVETRDGCTALFYHLEGEVLSPPDRRAVQSNQPEPEPQSQIRTMTR